MTDPYTPTEAEVRERFAWELVDQDGCGEVDPTLVADFDRWLAQHDAEVRQQVAREIRANLVTPRAVGDKTHNAGLEHAARLAEQGPADG